MPTNGYRST
jgi:hypothetical protein